MQAERIKAANEVKKRKNLYQRRNTILKVDYHKKEIMKTLLLPGKIGGKGDQMKNKIWCLLILTVCISFLSGCISYSEKMTLNKDFSGKATIRLAISNMMFTMMGESSSSMLKEMEESFKSSEKIALLESKTYNENDNQVFHFEIEFKSIEDLNSPEENSEEMPFIGEVSLVKEKDGKVTLKRVISGNENQKDVDPGMKSSLAGYKWTYELKTPYKIINANTSPAYIDHKTNTVKWEIPFLSVLNEPQELTVTMETFNPMIYIYAAGIGIVLLLIVFGVVVIKRKKGPTIVNTSDME